MELCTVQVAMSHERNSNLNRWEMISASPKDCLPCTGSPAEKERLSLEKGKAGRNEQGKEVKYEGSKRTHHIKVNQSCMGQSWR